MNIENLKEGLAKLESIDYNECLAYEHALNTFKSIGQLPILINQINYTVPLFRTRTHDTPDLFNNIVDISITPEKFVKEFARCNRPFQSVFYASENRPTSFMELLEYWSATKSVGDKLYITIGRWENTKPLNLIMITSPDPNKRLSPFDKYHGQAYDDNLKKKSKDEQEFTACFFDYMFEKFRKSAKNDNKTYIITTAYSNLALMYASENADGITYPSVPYQGQGTNYALRKSFVESALKITHAMYTEFEIHPLPENKKEFKESNSKLTSALALNGAIDWINLLDPPNINQ